MPRSDPASMPAATLEAAIRGAAQCLRAAGIEGAGRDARLLVGAAAGVSQADLIVGSGLGMPQVAQSRLATMLRRRTAREPVSRILGEREFYGRPFIVTPDTLDPRPDSETLITAALEIAAEAGWRQRPLRLIDIGTGTGCLLLTLLAELPLAHGVGTDISAAALDVARSNASRLGLSERAQFQQRHALDGGCDTFDMLVCNPPYISSRDIANLAADVRDYDPRLALDGGPDGLDVYRQIAPRLRHVVPAGWAVFEVGAGQAGSVSALLEGALVGQPGRLRRWQDLAGYPRCVALATHQ